MPNARIELPQSLTLPCVLNFVRELDYFSAHDRLIIDLPPKAFFSPFTMVLLSSKIRYLKQHCKDLTIIFNGWEHHGYLSHMGFFSMCGFDHGKDLGEARGSTDYLPITEITKAGFYEKASDKYEELPDLIQRHVDRISGVVARDRGENKNLFDVLSYSIREIFRNVFEHSEADSLFFCAQYWPRSNKVEFAVSDFGIGIRRGLGTNPNFRFPTDKDALEYSLLPGVSGKTHLPRTSSNWFNSGYGLYMTNRLARNGGNFVIVSGDSAIHFSKRTKNNYPTSFPGTAIRLNLNVEEIGDVQGRLQEFREDGKELAATIKGSGNRPPSAMSLLLRREYQMKL
ncbi:ATP-binding protein [Roseicyclus sp.]|uniref:ATP-binding protein n=1 Tax=Roseicyclus sp. TaxID=1914329 RepID=UPI003FA05550